MWLFAFMKTKRKRAWEPGGIVPRGTVKKNALDSTLECVISALNGGETMRGKREKKVNVNLYLPAEATDLLRGQLKSKGITLSGFFGVLIKEYVEILEGRGSLLSKPIDQMTLPELVEVMDFWVKRIREEEK